jgi:molecular chaperone GrpE
LPENERMKEAGKNQNHAEGKPVSGEEKERSSESHSDWKDHHHKDKKRIEEKEREIEQLKLKLEEKERQLKEEHDRLLRTAADFDNYKKRAAREKEEWSKYANEDLMKSILPFIDNLERAINHAEKVSDAGVLIEGVRLTIQQLLQGLSKFGLSTFDSVGKPFDPTVHEAMFVVATDEKEPNLVMEEFQKGYLLNDRLLRPATVSVSKPLGKEAQATE